MKDKTKLKILKFVEKLLNYTPRIVYEEKFKLLLHRTQCSVDKTLPQKAVTYRLAKEMFKSLKEQKLIMQYRRERKDCVIIHTVDIWVGKKIVNETA